MDRGFVEWATEIKNRFSNRPRRTILYTIYTLYLSIWHMITSRIKFGTNVYEYDWDLLIVLDACRVDTLRELADEYEYIDSIDTIWSVGSQSDEWMAKTFTSEWREEIAKTRYLTGNGHTEYVFENRDYPPTNNTIPFDFSAWKTVGESSFYEIENVWRTNHDEKYGVVLPSTLTDHAIVAGRDGGHDRMIVHYMQPHLPYIGKALTEGRSPTEIERRGYELLEEGTATRDEVYPLYRETLRAVLDEVAVLLENVDAEKAVITADHGEAFGEGFAYGHPEGFLHPTVKRVPWIELTATDERTRDPDVDDSGKEEIDVEDHLRDLGYM